jgi:hypothetical protein
LLARLFDGLTVRLTFRRVMMKTWLVIAMLIFSAAAANAQIAAVSVGKIISAEKIVKNAPFSADAVSESVQTLADGNRIVRRTTSHLYRDGEGRFRREDMPKQLGLAGTVIDMPESISIIDPVGGFRYTLNPKTNTVRQSSFRSAFDFKLKSELNYKLKMESDKVKEATKQVEKDSKAMSEQDAQNAGNAKSAERAEERAKRDEARKEQMAVRKAELEKRIQERVTAATTIAAPYAVSSKYETKTESLGVQNVEGVQAEGTRSTTTIPAGAIGNEREIEVVYEKWYSKDLQLTVTSKHNDPRTGEQSYRLTNIRRDEPPASLFSPPADYKLIEDGGPKPRAVVIAKPVTVIKVAPMAPTTPAVPKKSNEQ